MNYSSKTNQFPARELIMLQDAPADVLVRSLLRAAPVVALRGIAEVMLNEDSQKLRLMLLSQEFTNHWREFDSDLLSDERDFEYARQLELKLKEIK